MPQPIESDAVRTWCALALETLGEERRELDAINVFPVADGDTGTNLYRTLSEAAGALAERPDDPDPLATLARAALLGACGNSGTILAQLLYGLAESDPGDESMTGGGEEVPGAGDECHSAAGRSLARALRRAADFAYEAVAHPVEGTMLTVAAAAATAAEHAAGDGAEPVRVAEAAHQGACVALTATTSQLDVLARSSVVDAGARGLTLVLSALPPALSPGRAPARGETGPRQESGAQPRQGQGAQPRPGSGVSPDPDRGGTGAPRQPSPSHEVMYLLDADGAAVPPLRDTLDALPGADSLVIGGAHGLWSVHIHTDDPGAAVEAGITAGHPHRIRITHLAAPAPCAPGTGPAADGRGTYGQSGSHGAEPGEAPVRALVAVVPGDGLAGLCEEAGATVVRAPAPVPEAAPVDSEALLAAVERTGAREAVLLPNDPDLRATAAHAANTARARGLRAAVIPTRAAVQGIAALAVHEPDRDFDEDVVAMTAAAGATRYGEVAYAERQSWTMAGICQAGDVLGLVDGDVAVIGTAIEQTATDVLERMLAAGGEMVTLVVGAAAPASLAEHLEAHVRRAHLAVDTVVYEGRQRSSLLLIGVE